MFGGVFFVSRSLVVIERQRKLNKFVMASDRCENIDKLNVGYSQLFSILFISVNYILLCKNGKSALLLLKNNSQKYARI